MVHQRGVAMIENRVLVVWSPPGTANIIDFDLDHLLHAVDDARTRTFFFGTGVGLACGCCGIRVLRLPSVDP
jgi:hypothetical protein